MDNSFEKKEIETGNPCGVMANILNCSLAVSEFELPLYYYVYFWTNALRKGMNSLIPLVIS